MASVFDMLRKPAAKPTENKTMFSGLQPALPSIGPTVTPVTQPQTMLGAATQAAKPQIAPPMGGVQPLMNSGVAPKPNVGPMVPPSGMQPLQDFGPGNDLRSTQINPVPGQRLTGVQGMTDTLFGKIGQGPDLMQAALEKFKLLGENTADQRQRGIQDIGRSAARLGRLGSGMVTTDLGNLEERLRLNEDRERRGLASDLAFQEGAERRANLGAGQAFEQQLFGQGQGLRNEARTERDFQEGQAGRAFEQEILRRQLEVAYENMLRQLGLQGAALYGDQAAAGSQAASNLLAGSL